MSFRNRTIIAGSNGLIHLSVPLEKGRSQKVPVKEVKIANDGQWQSQHWRTIVSCYNRAPFFEFYSDWLKQFFSRPFTYLLDMNMEILGWLTNQLNIPSAISLTDQYLPVYPPGINDMRGQFKPNNYQLQASPIVYTQVFADRIGFQQNISILDLLFCTGPAARVLLAGSGT